MILYTGANTTVLVVETMNGDVFGGFVNEQWHVDTSYYGGGESFVFRIGERRFLLQHEYELRYCTMYA